MALPRSSLPPYANQSFLSPGAAEQYSLAQQLFFKYNPATLQRQLFEDLLKDEQFKALERQQQIEALQTRKENLDSLLARYRETGAGPSGSAKLAVGSRTATGRGGAGRGGAGGGGVGDNLDFLSDMTRNEIDRAEAAQKGALLAEDLLDEYDRKPRQFEIFEGDFVAGLDRKYRTGAPAPADLALELNQAFYETAGRMAGTLDQATPEQRAKAASDFYYKLRRRYPQLLTPQNGVLSADAMEVLDTIDTVYQTDGFLTQNITAGMEPANVVEQRRQVLRQSLLASQGIGVQPFEARGRELLGTLTAEQKDLNKDGKVSADEEAAAVKRTMEQARKELGIAEPLTDEEALLLSRYTNMLADDGRVSEEEQKAFGADFEAAKAAFEKGRRVENLPRGAAPFYDESYLRLLSERAGISAQEAELIGTGETPAQAAARRALGDIQMPQVPPEALEAARAAGGPLAADALPFALKRFTAASGAIAPESPVERFAQKLIDADIAKRPTFQDFAQQVGKKYFDDPNKRREALAYYGAYFHALDTRGTTLDEQQLSGEYAKELERQEREARKKEKALERSVEKDKELGFGVAGPMTERVPVTVPKPTTDITVEREPKERDFFLRSLFERDARDVGGEGGKGGRERVERPPRTSAPATVSDGLPSDAEIDLLPEEGTPPSPPLPPSPPSQPAAGTPPVMTAEQMAVAELAAPAQVGLTDQQKVQLLLMRKQLEEKQRQAEAERAKAAQDQAEVDALMQRVFGRSGL